MNQLEKEAGTPKSYTSKWLCQQQKLGLGLWDYEVHDYVVAVEAIFVGVMGNNEENERPLRFLNLIEIHEWGKNLNLKPHH